MRGAFYRTQGSFAGTGYFPVVQSLGYQERPMQVGVICLLPGSLSLRNQTKDKWERRSCISSHSDISGLTLLSTQHRETQQELL